MLKMSSATVWRKRKSNWSKKQRRYVSQQDTQKAINFYLSDASREMPGVKDTVLLKCPDGTKQAIQKHKLEMTQLNAFAQFKQAHPEAKMSQRHFDKLRPSNCQRLDTKDRKVCCCTYCENDRLMQNANRHFLQVHKADDPELMKDVTEMSLCSQGGQPFHYYDCVKRLCGNCGLHQVREAFQPVVDRHGDKQITWQTWITVKSTTKAGKETSHTLLSRTTTTYAEFMEVNIKHDN